MGSAGRVIIFILILLTCPGVRGQGQLLLIDRSGSMQPYYQSGLIGELGQRLTSIMRNQEWKPLRIGGFNNQVEIFPDVNRISVGGPTYLDVAIDYAIANRYKVTWLITDNIMHRSGEEEGKTTVFYDRLKTADVSHVVIFPLRQEPGKGHAGIIVYALLLSEEGLEGFTKETEEFARLTSGTERLPMKPLDRNTIEAVFVEPSKSGIKPKYSDGSVIKEGFEVRFKSKFDHLKIVDADIIKPRVAPEFSQNSLLNFEKDDVRITPTKITELGPRGETVQDYKIDVDLGKISLKRDPISLWRAALRNPNEDISLDLTFSINVPKDKFQFTDDFLRNYGADTTEKAKAEGKVYALNQLPLLVAEDQTAIDVPHRPKIHVTYPGWLVFIFPGIPLAVVLLLLAGGVLAWRAIGRNIKNRTVWTVHVQEPAGGQGSVRNGWVTVTTDRMPNRLGRIRKTQFVSANGVAPKGTQPLKDGSLLNLMFKKKNYSLIFRCSSPAGEPKRTAKEGRSKNGKRSQIKI